MSGIIEEETPDMLKYLMAGALAATVGSAANATTTVFNQGFEVDESGWIDDDDAGPGQINRVASGGGSLGITSFEGGYHGEFTQTSSGPFTRFDGYRSVFPGGYTARAAIYLDTSWNLGEGFDYSVASNGSDGNHQRDFIFHVTKDTSTGSLLVGGSNNTNFDPREDLETINNYEVTSSGWYIFEHVFRNDGGVLAVDLNLLSDTEALLFTETRSDPLDTIPGEVGGNRYGWFTNIDIAGGIAVDATSLSVVPVPAGVLLIASAFGITGGLSWRRARKAG
ncbi:MAG: hypothetical protein AAF676_01510 [Pseudomonadota bacterium]